MVDCHILQVVSFKNWLKLWQEQYVFIMNMYGQRMKDTIRIK